MPEENARWAEGSDVIPMFPTLVWKVELEAQLREAINARVLAALSRMRADLPPLAAGQGWQSIQTLHTLEDFREFVACVRRAVAGILRFLRIGYEALEITGCWATVLARGAEHKCTTTPTTS